MASSAPQAVTALVKQLQKTKGGVTVTEEGDLTVVRTRDGDAYRFDAAGKPIVSNQ